MATVGSKFGYTDALGNFISSISPYPSAINLSILEENKLPKSLIEKAFDLYNFTHDYINCFILDITDIPFIDIIDLVALKSMPTSIAHKDRKVHIVCHSPKILDKTRQKISELNVREHVCFCDSLDKAIGNK